MSNKPNQHIEEFDKFLDGINAIISPKLMRTDGNYQILRKAAFKLYNAKEEPETLVEAKVYERVFLGVKDQLQFLAEKPVKQEHYNLDASGRPVKPFMRSSYQSADDKKAQAAKEAEEAFNVAKGLKAAQAAGRERAQREAEENVVVLFETGRFQGRVNHSATDSARAANRLKWKNIDRQRGITNG